MSTTEFTERLRQWAEVFMHSTMRGSHQFSREHGISFAQLNVLHRLYHGGSCGVSEIGDNMGVTNAAVSQMIERLVQQGLLDRTEDPKDRRSKNITLTSKGADLVRESVEAGQRWLEELTVAFSPEQQQAIASALALLTEAARGLESRVGINPPATERN
jgi:DNA-binding MarR family transcriptional regulator